MQTFLPYTVFTLSASCIDPVRKGCQVKETLQIYNTLTGTSTAWQYHPVMNMWRGYEKALLAYGVAMYNGWKQWRRMVKPNDWSPKHKSGERLVELYIAIENESDFGIFHYNKPPWLGDNDFHSSHRSCLLAKDYDWYSRFGWIEKPTPPVNGRWPYVWPSSEGETDD